MAFLSKGLAVSFLVISLILCSLAFVNVQAQRQYRGLTISPVITELKVNPNQIYTINVEIFNDSTDNIDNIYTTLQTFTASEREGQPALRDFEADEMERFWIKFEEENFSLKAEEKKTVKVDLIVPNGTPSGSYFFALIFGKKGQEGTANVVLEQRIASLLFVEVSGMADRQVNSIVFASDKSMIDPFFDNIKLTSELQVTGRSFLRPSGQIVLTNNNQELFQTNFNKEQKIILPNSKRIFDMQFLSDKNIFNSKTVSASEPSDSSITNNHTISTPIFGSIDIQSNIPFVNSSGQLQVLQQNYQVIVFPYKTLAILIISLITLFGTIWFGSRLNKKFKTNNYAQ